MVATSSNQTMGLADRSFLKSLKASIIECLDGMVGDRLLELPDDQRKGEMFESVCLSVALLASCALEHMGEDVHVARCTRRLVASLLPAGEVGLLEEEEEDDAGDDDDERAADTGDESDAEMGDEEAKIAVDVDEDGAYEDCASEDGGPSDDADATTAINVGSFEKGMEEQAGEGEEGEEAGDQDEVDEEACSEVDVPESDEAECVSSEDSEDISDDPERDLRPSQTLDLDTEAMAEDNAPDLSQPALPMLPRQPCPAAAATASYMLQCLVRHPVFQQTAASDSISSFAAPLPPFAARLGTPLPSLLDLVELLPHPPAQDGNPASPLPPSAEPSTSSSSAQGGPTSLRLELLLLLESLIDMRRAFDASGSDNDDDVTAAAPSSQWPWGIRDKGANGANEEVSGLRALLRLLQCSYGASLSLEDRSCLRVMLLLDALLQGPPNGEGGLGGRATAV